jgi:hypothetical protein
MKRRSSCHFHFGLVVENRHRHRHTFPRASLYKRSALCQACVIIIPTPGITSLPKHLPNWTFVTCHVSRPLGKLLSTFIQVKSFTCRSPTSRIQELLQPCGPRIYLYGVSTYSNLPRAHSEVKLDCSHLCHAVHSPFERLQPCGNPLHFSDVTNPHLLIQIHSQQNQKGVMILPTN